MNVITKLYPAAVAGILATPLFAFAMDMGVASEGDAALEPFLFASKWVALALFVVAALIFIAASKKFGKSALGTVVTYFAIGTVLLLFSKGYDVVGGQLFNIADDSIMIWWHLLFYISFGFFFFGFKTLASLQTEGTDFEKIGKGLKTWAVLAALAVLYVYTIPSTGEPLVLAYLATSPAAFGLHHFIAFAIAGAVAYYVMAVRSKLGLIGKAIAMPMILAISALSLQHLWELLNESWGLIVVTGTFGESVEQVLLIICAGALIYGASKLLKTTKA